MKYDLNFSFLLSCVYSVLINLEELGGGNVI